MSRDLRPSGHDQVQSESMPFDSLLLALFVTGWGEEMCLCSHKPSALVQENSKPLVRINVFQEGELICW